MSARPDEYTFGAGSTRDGGGWVADDGPLFVRPDDNAENICPATDVGMIAAAPVPGADPDIGARERAHAINTSAAVQTVFDELQPHFDGELPASVVWDYVTQAAADLHGSISREALPEMVIRLAAVRLERHARPDQTTEETEHPHPTGPIFADDPARWSDPAGRPFTLLR